MKIEINHLYKAYRGRDILAIENIDFEPNKIYCIRGRNGTGKTTLLKIIAHLVTPDRSKMTYDGKEFVESLYQDITYLPANPYIFHQTVFENMAYPLRIRGMDTGMVQTYIDYFELSELKDKCATTCSSGEKMKIALARALVFHPKLLLLDEPTTNLDVESIEKLKQILIEIKKQTTIIFISHDIHFIQQVADEVYLLKAKTLERSESYVSSI